MTKAPISIRLLRNYSTRRTSPSDITVIEALVGACFISTHAGTGADNETFITASLIANNPIRHLISEAHDVFEGESRVAGILSIGPMRSEHIKFQTPEDPQFAQFVINTNGDQVKQQFAAQIGHIGIYFRFDLPNFPIDRTKDRWPSVIAASSSSYSEDHVGFDELEKCASRLQERKGLTTLKQLRECFLSAHPF
jgi:hypothetical protein